MCHTSKLLKKKNPENTRKEYLRERDPNKKNDYKKKETKGRIRIKKIKKMDEYKKKKSWEIKKD